MLDPGSISTAPMPWRCISACARASRAARSAASTGFTARVDPVRAGQRASAYVTVFSDQTQWQELREQLVAIEEVHHIAQLGGEFDIIILVRARSNRHLRQVLLDKIQTIPAVRSTRTHIVFEDVQTSSSPPAP